MLIGLRPRRSRVRVVDRGESIGSWLFIGSSYWVIARRIIDRQVGMKVLIWTAARSSDNRADWSISGVLDDTTIDQLHPPMIPSRPYTSLHHISLPAFFPFPFPLASSLTFFAALLASLTFSLAFFLASSTLTFVSCAICAGLRGTSSSRTPVPPRLAPRIRRRPSLSVSVIMGEAAGRYLNSSEYLIDQRKSPGRE